MLQLTSTLGIHASTVGVPLLLEALGESEVRTARTSAAPR